MLTRIRDLGACEIVRRTNLLVVRLLEHAGDLQAEVRKRVVDERMSETVRGEQDLVYGVDRL